jgi:hypothetical protein
MHVSQSYPHKFPFGWVKTSGLGVGYFLPTKLTSDKHERRVSVRPIINCKDVIDGKYRQK